MTKEVKLDAAGLEAAARVLHRQQEIEYDFERERATFEQQAAEIIHAYAFNTTPSDIGVERIARLMCKAAMYDPDLCVHGSGGTDVEFVCHRRKWQDYAALAKVAIDALAATVPTDTGDWVLVPREPTPDMLKAAMDDFGWWVEPYEAPRESGVPVESDMSAEDAAKINATQMAAISDAYAAMLSARPAPLQEGAKADDAYEIGERDGYEQAVQDIDVMTGGDGEYRFCTDGDPDRHTPDAATMKRRIVDRFDSLAHASEPRETGWLIELRGQTPTWFQPVDGDNWTADSTKALRFARKIDADTYIEDIGWTEAFASEHEWLAPRLSPEQSEVKK